VMRWGACRKAGHMARQLVMHRTRENIERLF